MIKTFAVTEQKQRKHDIFCENLVRDVHAWVTYIELIIYQCNTISQLHTKYLSPNYKRYIFVFLYHISDL
jgi:hypothetical protein